MSIGMWCDQLGSAARFLMCVRVTPSSVAAAAGSNSVS